MNNNQEQSINDIIAILDNYAMNEGSRMKIKVEDGNGEMLSRQYHHGRCDVCRLSYRNEKRRNSFFYGVGV